MAANYCEIYEKFGADVKELGGMTPKLMGGFGALHHAACDGEADDFVLRELIALGIAIATHCDGCIAAHTTALLQGGATEKDVLTAIDVAIFMGGGPGLVYSTHALEALKQFKAAS